MLTENLTVLKNLNCQNLTVFKKLKVQQNFSNLKSPLNSQQNVHSLILNSHFFRNQFKVFKQIPIEVLQQIQGFIDPFYIHKPSPLCRIVIASDN